MTEVVRRHEGASPKSLNSDEIFKPQHKLFCRDINIWCDLHSCWKIFEEQSASLGQTQCFLGKRCTIT